MVKTSFRERFYIAIDILITNYYDVIVIMTSLSKNTHIYSTCFLSRWRMTSLVEDLRSAYVLFTVFLSSVSELVISLSTCGCERTYSEPCWVLLWGITPAGNLPKHSARKKMYTNISNTSLVGFMSAQFTVESMQNYNIVRLWFKGHQRHLSVYSFAHNIQSICP